MYKYCPKCGEKLVENARFCKNCGANLENIQNNTPSQDGFHVPVVEKDHKIAIIIGYICAVLIPIVGLIFSVYLLTRQSEKAKKHGKYMLVVTLIVWFLSFLSIFRGF